jgi:hypothetical protein
MQQPCSLVLTCAPCALASLLTRSLTHSLTHSLARSLIHSLTYSLTHSLTHSLTTRSLTLSLSLTHSLARWLAGSLAHWLTPLIHLALSFAVCALQAMAAEQRRVEFELKDLRHALGAEKTSASAQVRRRAS